MTGLPYPFRLAGYGVPAPKDRVRGREVAGQVVALGRNVTTFAVGDEVGVGEGSFAEYARAAADKPAPKPANLTVEQAARAVGLSPHRCRPSGTGRGCGSGQRVLVIGASGGPGRRRGRWWYPTHDHRLGLPAQPVARSSTGRQAKDSRGASLYRWHQHPVTSPRVPTPSAGRPSSPRWRVRRRSPVPLPSCARFCRSAPGANG